MRHHLDGNARAADAHYDQPDEIGHHEGETCGRYLEPDEDMPRGYRPKPCRGLMRHEQIKGIRLLNYVTCDTCGEIGE